MDLKSYFEGLSEAERDTAAKAAGTKWVYISQIIRGHRQPSTGLARELHRVSKGKIALSSLRPDVWTE